MTFPFSSSALTRNPGDVVLDPFCGCGTTVVIVLDEMFKKAPESKSKRDRQTEFNV